MVQLTPEERKVALFILSLALSGIILNHLTKTCCWVAAAVYPAPQLARLNLNQVSLAQLEATKCVPAKIAQEIIFSRDLHQGFSGWEQVREIKGIGKQRFDKLQEFFLIE